MFHTLRKRLAILLTIYFYLGQAYTHYGFFPENLCFLIIGLASLLLPCYMLMQSKILTEHRPWFTLYSSLETWYIRLSLMFCRMSHLNLLLTFSSSIKSSTLIMYSCGNNFFLAFLFWFIFTDSFWCPRALERCCRDCVSLLHKLHQCWWGLGAHWRRSGLSALFRTLTLSILYISKL